jgi:hypothetical protein
MTRTRLPRITPLFAQWMMAVVTLLAVANPGVLEPLAVTRISELEVTTSLTATAASSSVGDLRGTVITPSSVSGIVNNWAPTGIATATVISVTPSGGIDLTGIDTGAAGRFLTVRNDGGAGFNITLYHENVSSDEENRLDLAGDTAWVLRSPGDSITFAYFGSRWVMVGHGGRGYPGLVMTANIDMQGVGSLSSVFHITGGGAAPALSSCGGSPTISGTDLAGTVTTGTAAAACTITFVAAYASAPRCVVTARAGANQASTTYTTSTSALTLSAAAATAVYDYVCIQ